MTEKLDIQALTAEQNAALDASGAALLGLGKVLISTEHTPKERPFLAMIPTKNGAHVFAYGATLSEAMDGAIQKYIAWEPASEPIRSAVDVVILIRERLAAGEDPAEVLDSLNVA